MASAVYVEHDGTNLHRGGNRGEIARWYTLMAPTAMRVGRLPDITATSRPLTRPKTIHNLTNLFGQFGNRQTRARLND